MLTRAHLNNFITIEWLKNERFINDKSKYVCMGEDIHLIIPKPVMSRRGFLKLAGAGAAVGITTYELGKEPAYRLVDSIYESLGLNPDTQGIIVSSNMDFMYTQLNLEHLKENGFKRVYVQKTVRNNGDIFYRTIIGTTDRNHKESLEKLLNDDHFNPGKKNNPYQFMNAEQILPLYSEPKEKRKQKMQELEREFTVNIEKIKDKENYTRIAVPFVMERYRLHHKDKGGKKLAKNEAHNIASRVYESAHEFNIPVVDYLALISNESKFINGLGDERFINKKKPELSNHSEGYIQMRIKTQKWVLKKMKEEGIEGLPKTIPYDTIIKGKRDSLLNHSELQFRLGAWYFRHCLLKSGWNGESRVIPAEIIDKALSKYNMGHNADTQNEKYIERVNEEKEIYQQTVPDS